MQGILREPRYDLVRAPTPPQRLPGFERPLGGNKLRSLEFWLGAALREHADIILVAGGLTSDLLPSHRRRRLDGGARLRDHLQCEDNPTNRERSCPSRLFGAETRFVGPVVEEDRDVAMGASPAELKRQGRSSHTVGDAVLGARGYALAAFELHEPSQRLSEA